jgi:hypothetical protein
MWIRHRILLLMGHKFGRRGDGKQPFLGQVVEEEVMKEDSGDHMKW